MDQSDGQVIMIGENFSIAEPIGWRFGGKNVHAVQPADNADTHTKLLRTIFNDINETTPVVVYLDVNYAANRINAMEIDAILQIAEARKAGIVIVGDDYHDALIDAMQQALDETKPTVLPKTAGIDEISDAINMLLETPRSGGPEMER